MARRLYQDLWIKLSRFGTLIVEKSSTHYQVTDISSMNSRNISKYNRNRNVINMTLSVRYNIIFIIANKFV